MVFSSLLFIFAFLVPCMIIYTLVDASKKNKVLLIFSLIFYSWGGPRYLILLLVDTWASWWFALQISRHRKQAKPYLVGECIVLLGLLGIFKYTVFFCSNFHAWFGIPKVIPQIVLPIGISFYTFQLLSYVIDVYRKEVKAQTKFWKLLLYSSLFHQCIAGPIVRYETVASEIEHRPVFRKDIYEGIRRFCVGLAKKAILANGCASVADTLLPFQQSALQNQAITGLWLGMLFYMLQIYLDFSAYSDMAIGMGRMVGFHYLENFNYPYMAHSVQDFWRKWHISLSTFFRDYVYIPLGGSRCSKAKFIRNMTIVWFLTGMWHGASWNYILWGLYYLVFLLLERFVYGNRLRSIGAHVYTLLVVYIGWVIFRFENGSQLFTVLGGMIGMGSHAFTSMQVHTLFLENIFFLLFCILACTYVGKAIRHLLPIMGRSNGIIYNIYTWGELLLPPVLLILSVLALIGNSYNPFLYFQF